MTVTLAFLAVLMAFFVGWLLRQSINVKPWVAGSTAAHEASSLPERFSAGRVGLAVFVAVATSIFALTISAYMMRMHMGTHWQHLHVPQMLWANTALLLLASVALQVAWNGARRGNSRQLRIGLTLGGGCSVAFIAGQFLAWRQLDAAGYYLTASAASAFFYLMTTLHGLHLLGGLVAWAKTVLKVARGRELAQVRSSVELCTLYWHYLFIVWIVLFSVLLMH